MVASGAFHLGSVRRKAHKIKLYSFGAEMLTVQLFCSKFVQGHRCFLIRLLFV